MKVFTIYVKHNVSHNHVWDSSPGLAILVYLFALGLDTSVQIENIFYSLTSYTVPNYVKKAIIGELREDNMKEVKPYIRF